ncbi:pyridoxamine 5'-phosphate oxidase family protein [Streptomyces sp. BBFR102]|uniref:pyridoxamine 5'-phosphate oxidase family protein n=1 Tax=Streptomyces sp. BBFR102 TaxID=3448171 RepID=UPI003F5356DA
MATSDVREFLARPLVARVATAGPTVRPVRFLWEDGAFRWLTGAYARLGHRLAEDRAVALVVDTCDLATGRVLSVTCRGTAEVVELDRARAVRKLTRYLGPRRGGRCGSRPRRTTRRPGWCGVCPNVRRWCATCRGEGGGTGRAGRTAGFGPAAAYERYRPGCSAELLGLVTACGGGPVRTAPEIGAATGRHDQAVASRGERGHRPRHGRAHRAAPARAGGCPDRGTCSSGGAPGAGPSPPHVRTGRSPGRWGVRVGRTPARAEPEAGSAGW